jgi:hypothetical protein
MSFLSRRSAEPESAAALPYDPRSAEGLAARWVQWVASAGPLKNPLEDETGEHAAHNQPDDVWFLAGSYGRRMERRCVVPAGRDLFLPMFNMWYFPAEGPPAPVEGISGSLAVDGVPLEPDVIATPVPFTVTGARLNGVTQRKKPLPVTVWGLWKLIPALPVGEHVVRAVGGDGYSFTVDVTYRVLVGGTIPVYPTR